MATSTRVISLMNDGIFNKRLLDRFTSHIGFDHVDGVLRLNVACPAGIARDALDRRLQVFYVEDGVVLASRLICVGAHRRGRAPLVLTVPEHVLMRELPPSHRHRGVHLNLITTWRYLPSEQRTYTSPRDLLDAISA